MRRGGGAAFQQRGSKREVEYRGGRRGWLRCGLATKAQQRGAGPSIVQALELHVDVVFGIALVHAAAAAAALGPRAAPAAKHALQRRACRRGGGRMEQRGRRLSGAGRRRLEAGGRRVAAQAARPARRQAPLAAAPRTEKGVAAAPLLLPRVIPVRLLLLPHRPGIQIVAAVAGRGGAGHRRGVGWRGRGARRRAAVRTCPGRPRAAAAGARGRRSAGRRT